MAENNFTSQNSASSGCFKEAVCINAGRVYDSCSDKDCVELRVVFTDTAQQIIDNATSIKCKAVQVMDVFMDVEPVPFNKGFYSVDMTFYFVVQLEACTMETITPIPVDGLAVFTKKSSCMAAKEMSTYLHLTKTAFARRILTLETLRPNQWFKWLIRSVWRQKSRNAVRQNAASAYRLLLPTALTANSLQ